MSGERRLVCVTDFEHQAVDLLPKNALDYYRSGAGEEFTLNLNSDSFRRLRILPRFMRDVSRRNQSTGVLGSKVALPVGVAPTAMQRMAHPEGECASARAEECGCEECNNWRIFSQKTSELLGIYSLLYPLMNFDHVDTIHNAMKSMAVADIFRRLSTHDTDFSDVILNWSSQDDLIFIPCHALNLAMIGPSGKAKLMKMAVGAMGGVFILSTLSTSSLEEVAAAAPNTTKWFQLYIYNDRDVTCKLVQRAEKAGYKALVLTVDAPMFGIRIADVRNKFTLPPHLTLANFEGNKATDVNKSESGSGINEYVKKLFDQSLTWEDVTWLKEITKLPVILKGILTAEDALIAADVGAAGILVSNHGARQVDCTPASIEALPEIVKAVEGRCEIYLDGGVRQGTDVFKALALGAKMVFIGRPVLWGLTVAGEDGVKTILNIIKTELDSVMALTGCRTLKDIKKDMIVHESHYSRL